MTNPRVVLVLFCFLATGHCDPSAAPKVDNDISSLKTQVHQLEEAVSKLQSHSQVQDQKYAAVLSSVLSKLTDTTDKLTNTSDQLALTTDELVKVKSELHSVKGDYKSLHTESATVRDQLTLTTNKLTNVTSELQSARGDYKSLESELATVKKNEAKHENLTTTQQISLPKVSFRVIQPLIMSKYKSNKVIYYQHVMFAAGGGYSQTTGKFIAPVSGIYLFWSKTVMYPGPTHIYVNMRVESLIFTSVGQHNGKDLFFADLSKGNSVWMQYSLSGVSSGAVDKSSEFGGMLLAEH